MSRSSTQLFSFSSSCYRRSNTIVYQVGRVTAWTRNYSITQAAPSEVHPYNRSKTKLHVPPRNPSKLHIIPDMSIIIIIIIIGFVNCYYDRRLYDAQRIYIYIDFVRIHGSVFAPQSNFINVTNSNNRSGLRWCALSRSCAPKNVLDI